jgi:hypothetical protein
MSVEGADSEEQASTAETLSPEAQAVVRNCLTESELYLTYKQVPQAIDVLEQGLAKVPGDASLQEQLLPLYEQTQQFEKAEEVSRALADAYASVGDEERATRYSELIPDYQQKVREAAQAAAEKALQAEAVEAAQPSLPEAVSEEPQVREIDLSMEWATLSDSGTRATTSSTESIVEEIEFYLQAGLVGEAVAAMQRLREAAPEHSSLAAFDERLAALQPAASGSIAQPQTETAEQAPVIEAEGDTELAAQEASPSSAEPLEPTAIAPQKIETAEAPAEAPQLLEQPQAAAEPEQELVLDELLQSSVSTPPGFELSLDEPQAPRTSAASSQAKTLSHRLLQAPVITSRHPCPPQARPPERDFSMMSLPSSRKTLEKLSVPAKKILRHTIIWVWPSRRWHYTMKPLGSFRRSTSCLRARRTIPT